MATALGPGQLTIGETGTQREWGGQTSKTVLTSETNSEDSIPVLDGSNIDGEDTTTYSLTGTVFQDYDAESLVVWTHENKGKTLPFVFEPITGGISISGLVKIRPLDIGGDVKKKNTSDFDWPLLGEPTFA